MTNINITKETQIAIDFINRSSKLTSFCSEDSCTNISVHNIKYSILEELQKIFGGSFNLLCNSTTYVLVIQFNNITFNLFSNDNN